MTVEGSVAVADEASPIQRKVHGSRYSVSAYRLATGNAVASAASTELGVTDLYSAGGAMTQAITVTPDANGIVIGTNVTAGTGLTGTPTGVFNYAVNINGTGGTAIVPSQL